MKLLKTLSTMILTLIILLPPVCAFSSERGYMRIHLIEGAVQIKAADSDDWDNASVNEPVGEGDQIWTPEGSRVELQLNNGTYIRLDEMSSFQILSMDGDSSQFYLSQGDVYINNRLPKGNVIQVDTPDLSTRVFKKSIFRIDLSDGYTDVSVYKGQVETENRTVTTGVKAGSMISFGPDTNGEISQLELPDEWEKWNKVRNSLIKTGNDASSRYLPSELKGYSRDFDDSGKWVESPQYGYVWTPTVVIGTSWSPYRHGRWIIRHGNYVWVATETWGWVPYHYGRWTYISSIGWVWVPPAAHDVCWGPGYVGWVKTPEYVAWVPLAPGEVYYGRGKYGRDSVNVTVNVTNVNVTRVYQNVRVDNGVMVVHRDRFTTGTPQFERINQRVIHEKIFTGEKINVFTPSATPVKVKRDFQIPPLSDTKHPPAAVRNIQVGPLKHSRPFIREPERSVFRPGIKTDSSPVKTFVSPESPDRVKPPVQPDKPGEIRTMTPKENPSPGISGFRIRDDRQRIKPDETRASQPEDRRAVRHDRNRKKYEENIPSASPVPSSVKDDRQRMKTDEIRVPKPAVREEKSRPDSETVNPSEKDSQTTRKDKKQRIKKEKEDQPDSENINNKDGRNRKSDPEPVEKRERKHGRLFDTLR